MLRDGVAQPVETALAQNEFQSRFVLVLAISVDVKHPDHRFHAPHDVLGGNELVQNTWLRVGRGPRPPATVMRKPRSPSRIAARRPTSLIAVAMQSSGQAAESDLELARKVVGQFLVQKRERQAPRVRLDIERLPRDASRKAGKR